MKTPLTAVQGIGAVAAKRLGEHGIVAAEDLVAAGAAAVAKLPGFGPASAKRLVTAAKNLLEGKPVATRAAKPRPAATARQPQATPAVAADPAAEQPGDKQQPKKDGKKSKKGKKGKKNKRVVPDHP